MEVFRKCRGNSSNLAQVLTNPLSCHTVNKLKIGHLFSSSSDMRVCETGAKPLHWSPIDDNVARGSRYTASSRSIANSRSHTWLLLWGTFVLGYSSSAAMRNPRMKSMVFCRSFGVCLPIRLGGGRMRRLAKSVAMRLAVRLLLCECLRSSFRKAIKYRNTLRWARGNWEINCLQRRLSWEQSRHRW